MTIQEITSDPRWANANGDQRKQLLSLASDAPPALQQYGGTLLENLGQDIPKAVNDIATKPFNYAKDLATNPRTMANALPPVASAASAFVPLPGSTTAMTVGARQISNAALRGLGHPEDIPSTGSQVLEGGLSALGDLTAIPAIKGKVYGNAIGKIEEAQGVPQFPESLQRPGGPAPTTQWIDDTRKAIANGEIANNEPVIAKQIKDQVNFIYQNRKDVPLTPSDEGKLAMLGSWAQDALNRGVPGRAGPAGDMASSLAIPNAIKRGYNALPSSVRTGIGISAPPVGAGLAYELGKRIFGGNQ